MPPQTVVASILAHARSAEEAGALLAKATKLGYRADIKRDVLAAIKTPPLAGVTLDGTSGKVQSVNPAALVAFAEQNGFGAEAGAVLNLALNAEGSGRVRVEYRPVGLAGIVASALGH